MIRRQIERLRQINAELDFLTANGPVPQGSLIWFGMDAAGLHRIIRSESGCQGICREGQLADRRTVATVEGYVRRRIDPGWHVVG